MRNPYELSVAQRYETKVVFEINVNGIYTVTKVVIEIYVLCLSLRLSSNVAVFEISICYFQSY